MLNILLEEVIDDPQKNTKEHLEKRIKELEKLSDQELEKMAKEAKIKKEEFKKEIDQKIKEKYNV